MSAVDAIIAAARADVVSVDDALCDLYAHDVYERGATPLAVLQPANIQELSAGIRAATAQGLAIVPRGGGMSYTGGYIAPDMPFILIDMGRMKRVLAINPADRTVTVEAGISWAELREALLPHGLRARVWGTLSGLHASVGGGMSQNGTFWGANNGSLADSALSMDVVLADGSVLTTAKPHFRGFGPDLTGLFCGDGGALGVKAHVTLRLVAEGKGLAYGSFAFDTAEAFFTGMAIAAREGLSTECFGFDPYLQSQRMKRDSIANDAKSLLTMMKAQGSIFKGLKEGAKVALAGRGFLDDVPFSMHAITERRRKAEADADMAELTHLLAEVGGRAIENTVPKMARSMPFPPVNAMVGPAGERWVPTHGLFQNSRLNEAWEAMVAFFAERAGEMELHGVTWGALLAAASPQVSIIEPVFYWPDELNPLHHHAVEAGHMKKLTRFPANAAATAYVGQLRKDLVALFATLDAAHFQVGRSYPLKVSHDAQAWGVLEAVKAAVDPQRLMNPGVIGL